MASKIASSEKVNMHKRIAMGDKSAAKTAGAGSSSKKGNMDDCNCSHKKGKK